MIILTVDFHKMRPASEHNAGQEEIAARLWHNLDRMAQAFRFKITAEVRD
jgi:hypothetical protein